MSQEKLIEQQYIQQAIQALSPSNHREKMKWQYKYENGDTEIIGAVHSLAVQYQDRAIREQENMRRIQSEQALQREQQRIEEQRMEEEQEQHFEQVRLDTIRQIQESKAQRKEEQETFVAEFREFVLDCPVLNKEALKTIAGYVSGMLNSGYAQGQSLGQRKMNCFYQIGMKSRYEDSKVSETYEAYTQWSYDRR